MRMPGARAGGLGSVRIEATGSRHREQSGARSLSRLPQPAQEIDAIQFRPSRVDSSGFELFSTEGA